MKKLKEVRCPPGYVYDSKTKTCVPKRGKRVYFRYPYFGGSAKKADPQPSNGNGNGNGNGAGNGNGNGNGSGNGSGNGGGNGSGNGGGNGGGGNGG